MSNSFRSGLAVSLPGWPSIAALCVRIAAGTIFLIAGIGKFAMHAKEAKDFARWNVPSPSAMVYVVGVIEVLGGLALLFGFLTRPAAVVLGMNMLGALLSAGRVDGAPHTIIAPILIVGMLFLIWAGPGRAALDTRLAPIYSGDARQTPL